MQRLGALFCRRVNLVSENIVCVGPGDGEIQTGRQLACFRLAQPWGQHRNWRVIRVEFPSRHHVAPQRFHHWRKQPAGSTDPFRQGGAIYTSIDLRGMLSLALRRSSKLLCTLYALGPPSLLVAAGILLQKDDSAI
jgi:hypothetical protein